MESGFLSDGARLLRRSSISFQKENVDLLRHYRSDHPFFRLLAGWNQRLWEDLRQRGRLLFEIEASYYQSVLSTFQSMTDKSVTAIADLTDDTEAFWFSGPDPLKTSVRERIFVVNWRTFFDTKKFSLLWEFLKAQSKEYTVRLILSSTVQGLQSQHHFGDIGVGYHLLLMSPDLVGGYVKKKQQRLLHIESNPTLYATATHFYREVQERSFQVEPGWTAEQLRRAWMKNDRVGLWNPDWHEVESRSDDYFSHYDIHIRFWIPFYEELIKHTAAIVQSEIANLMRNNSQAIEILEIGFGTGALTRPLVNWIQNLNQPFRVMGVTPPITRYLGIDRADPMVELLKQESRSWGSSFEASFVNGVALEGLERILSDSLYSVIFGSLVLHDLFTAPSPSLVEVFRGFRRFLAPNGSLVFADVFFSEAIKNIQLEMWKKKMESNGLSRDEVDVFFDSNPEMLSSLPLDSMRAAAAEAGFSFFDTGPLPNPGLRWPFRAIVLRAQSAQLSKVQQWPRAHIQNPGPKA